MNPSSPSTHELAAEVVARLTAAGHTLAVAESLTGGLVCSAVVDIPGASAVLRGGVVAYATDLKARLLAVDLTLLAQAGPVDGRVAAQLATGVRGRLSADWGVATTGVAGPDPQGDCPPGTVFVAVAVAGENAPVVRRLSLAGDRAQVRAAAVHSALGLLLDELREEEIRRSNDSARGGTPRVRGELG